LLGTGTAFNEDGRGNQAILVEPAAGTAPFLVDVGPTAVAAMMRFGVAHEALDRLFVTHLHGDHVAGWPFLLLHWVFVTRRERPFDVFGPVGVRECLEGLTRLCYREIQQDGKMQFELRYHEIDPRQGALGADAAAGLVYDALPMDHHPSSLGYRFVCGAAASFGVSGDTRWCTGLERLAATSRTLVVECSSVEERPHAHLSLSEIRRRRAELGTADLVLVHLPDAVALELARDPIARVTAAYDGMDYPLGR
jgi:ribonuclease BN (tRNA processing enzyme)